MSETRQVPPSEVPDEMAPEPPGNGLRGVLRRRLTETTTWTFLILLGIVAGFAALRFQQFATVQKKIGTGFVVVTKENMNDPDVKPFLYKSSC